MFMFGVEETGHEREYANVAFVAYMRGFLIVVNGGVAVGVVFFGPVEVVDVATNGFGDFAVFGCVVVFAEVGCDALDVATHEAHPADQIEVELARVRGLGARVVVQT